MNDATMSQIGFFTGFSYSTFSFLGNFLSTGSRAKAADLLVRDMSILLVFDWSLSTVKKGTKLLNIPIGPLGQLGSFVNGLNPNKTLLNSNLKLLIAEGEATVSALAETYKHLNDLGSTAKGPKSFNPDFNEIKSLGGFVNGARWFLSLLR